MAIRRNVKDTEESFQRIHFKKLEKLTGNKSLPHAPEEVITNLSGYELTVDEAEILKYGLYHPIPPAKISKSDVFTNFDILSRYICGHLKEPTRVGEVRAHLSHLANNYVLGYKPSSSTLRKHGIFKRLRRNRDIVITRPDKGNDVVLMNRADYGKDILA